MLSTVLAGGIATGFICRFKPNQVRKSLTQVYYMSATVLRPLPFGMAFFSASTAPANCNTLTARRSETPCTGIPRFSTRCPPLSTANSYPLHSDIVLCQGWRVKKLWGPTGHLELSTECNSTGRGLRWLDRTYLEETTNKIRGASFVPVCPLVGQTGALYTRTVIQPRSQCKPVQHCNTLVFCLRLWKIGFPI